MPPVPADWLPQLEALLQLSVGRRGVTLRLGVPCGRRCRACLHLALSYSPTADMVDETEAGVAAAAAAAHAELRAYKESVAQCFGAAPVQVIFFERREGRQPRPLAAADGHETTGRGSEARTIHALCVPLAAANGVLSELIHVAEAAPLGVGELSPAVGELLPECGKAASADKLAGAGAGSLAIELESLCFRGVCGRATPSGRHVARALAKAARRHLEQQCA